MVFSLVEMHFKKIEELIKKVGWYYFGNKKFECPGLGEECIEFYLKNSRLPPPCDGCFKVLIFWKEENSRENLKNFFSMIDSLETNYAGKLNEDVVVFYFRDKVKMLEFLKCLGSKMKKFNVVGRIEWRRACKAYQELKPELWKNAKEFVPDSLNKPK